MCKTLFKKTSPMPVHCLLLTAVMLLASCAPQPPDTRLIPLREFPFLQSPLDISPFIELTFPSPTVTQGGVNPSILPCTTLFSEDFEGIDFHVSQTSNAAGTNWYVENVSEATTMGLPAACAQGSLCAWATYNSSGYGDDAAALLFSEDINLSQAHGAVLEFKIYYNTEMEYDGLVITATPGLHSDWYFLEPVGGYPAAMSQQPWANGYTGNSSGWLTQQVDLSPLVASQPGPWILAFYFVSDANITQVGVLIDDIRVFIPCVETTTPQAACCTVSAKQAINCHQGPNNNYPVVAYLYQGETVQALGRNPDASWLAITTPGQSAVCWVWGGIVEVTGDARLLSLYDYPPLLIPSETVTACQPPPGGCIGNTSALCWDAAACACLPCPP